MAASVAEQLASAGLVQLNAVVTDSPGVREQLKQASDVRNMFYCAFTML